MTQQTEIQTKVLPEATQINDNEIKNLPMVVLEKVTQIGTLVSVQDFSEEDWKKVDAISSAFSMDSSASILRFGAEETRESHKYLDELLKGISTNDIGDIGSTIMIGLSGTIDFMAINEVKKQIQNPPGFLKKLLGFTDYIKLFFEKRKAIIDRMEQLEIQGNNEIATLTIAADKSDKLIEVTIRQIDHLRILIAAGEKILLREQENYQKQRDELYAQEPINTVKASELYDYKNRITQFEVRLLRLMASFVENASIAIKEIRDSSEAIRIGIQKIDEAVLFDLADFKRVIIQLANLQSLEKALNLHDKWKKSLQQAKETVGDLTNELSLRAKESQGDPLLQAQAIANHLDKMMQGMQSSIDAVNSATEARKQATALLISTKEKMDTATKEYLTHMTN